jgi:hypothetical protein
VSVKCTSAVWATSTAKGGALLLLHAIAYHAHDDGTGAWPSIARLMEMTKFSERNVHYLLRQLEKDGELAIQQGAGPRGTNSYAVTVPGLLAAEQSPPVEADTPPLAGVQSLQGGAIFAGAKIAGGVQNPHDDAAKIAGGGAKSGTEIAPEPLVNRQERGMKTREGRKAPTAPPPPPRLTLATYQPDQDIAAWAAQHCPHVDLAAAVEHWRDWHAAKGDAIKDFAASLRAWLRREQPPRAPGFASQSTARRADANGKLNGHDAAAEAIRLLRRQDGGLSPPYDPPDDAIEATYTVQRRGP